MRDAATIRQEGIYPYHLGGFEIYAAFDDDEGRSLMLHEPKNATMKEMIVMSISGDTSVDTIEFDVKRAKAVRDGLTLFLEGLE